MIRFVVGVAVGVAGSYLVALFLSSSREPEWPEDVWPSSEPVTYRITVNADGRTDEWT